ncbi:hypothetical protein GCM10011404_17330 [Sphingomonas prati]|nr:hypothetical protein GCM10011404_17330 [Sphingomonas prati]
MPAFVTLLSLSIVTALPLAGVTDPAATMLTLSAAPALTVAVRTAVVCLVSMTVWAPADPATDRARIPVEASSRRTVSIPFELVFRDQDGAIRSQPWTRSSRRAAVPAVGCFTSK